MTTVPNARPRRRHGAGRSAAHGSATVAVWTTVSRATGLLRVMVIGAVLGPTFAANTFVATNNVPNLTYSAVAGPVLALVVVPGIVRTVLAQGPAAGALAVRRLSGLLLKASGAVALLLVLAAPVLAWTLTLGVPAAQQGRARLVATVMLVLVAPQVLLYTLAALGAAAQQARRRYALANAAPAIENVGLIATMAVVAWWAHPGSDGDVLGMDVVLLLGLGATGSVALHALAQAVGAARVGLPLRPARDWRADPEAREVARRLRRSVVVAALPAGSFYLLLAVAATMPGGVLVFQIAYLVYQVPTALGARAVTTAVLPGMSAAATDVDRTRYAGAWRQALLYGTVCGLPSLCVLTVFALPVADVLAAGRLHDRALIGSLAVCIAVLGFSQLAGGLHEIGRQALFARLDVAGPRLACVIAFGATLAAGALSLLLPAGLPRLVGLAAAVLLADTAAAITVLTRVRRSLRPERAVDARRVGVVLIATVAMLPVLAAGRWLLGTGGRLHELAVMLPSVALAVAVFAAVLLRRRPRPVGAA